MALALALLPLHAARAADPTSPAPQVLGWDTHAHGAFVTALCPDPYGHLWIGTEGKGLWRLSPSASPARRYAHYEVGKRDPGFPDNDVHTLAADPAGRVWVGTGRGLCVWDGKHFAVYGPPEGLGGWHVSALAVCPADGDVWAATEGGLTRYSQAQQTWAQYGRPEGLPSDAISCLAFARDGTLYVGTQADGVAVASPNNDYHTWRATRGPDAAPLAGGGDGLPSSLINALLVAEDGAVYAGTPAGLARSADGGATWQFRRGADWADKVKRLYRAPDAPAPVAPKAANASFLSQDLTEDWVTCLADDGAGHLAVGHRQTGVEIISLKGGQRLFPVPGGAATEPADFVASVLSTTDGGLVVGGYGGGLLGLPLPAPDPVTPSTPPPAPVVPPAQIGALPPPAAPPTLPELNALLKTASTVPPDKSEYAPHVVALADDWLTRGDWLGRYGRYWACLCAMCSPQDYLWGAGWQPVDYASYMGPNHKPGDSLRYWVGTLYTNDPRVLELPPTYLDSRIKKGLTDAKKPRRDASQDDHGETYPLTMEGPDVYEDVSVPAGLYVLSLYEENPLRGGRSRLRDYRLSLHARPEGTEPGDVGTLAQQPELARGRVTGFYGGVWKRFLVRGPLALTVKVNRSYSQNTMLPAVTLDLLDEAPPPYFGTVKEWEAAQAQQQQHWQHLLTQGRGVFHPAASEAEAANRLCDALAGMQSVNSAWWAQNARPDYGPLLRWYAAQARVPSAAPRPALWRRLASCYYGLGMYPEWEQGQRLAGLTPARDVEKALRWDGISGEGQDYLVVTRYLAGRRREAMAGPSCGLAYSHAAAGTPYYETNRESVPAKVSSTDVAGNRTLSITRGAARE